MITDTIDMYTPSHGDEVMPAMIDNCTVLQRIGQGTSGVVLEIVDKDGKKKALKLMRRPFERRVLNHFLLEAKMVSEFEHPNIVMILGWGFHGDRPYLKMERLVGEDLRMAMGTRSFTVIEKAKLMLQLAQALSYAHDHGSVHRDVKPANVFLTSDGVIKLLDFSAAKFEAEAIGDKTKTGILTGTVLYMGPEQVQGHKPGRHFDIWGFGVTFHEFLSGGNPFDADTVVASIFKIAHLPIPSLCVTNPLVPSKLAQIVDKCLVKNITLRYQNMIDVVRDLSSALADLRPEAAKICDRHLAVTDILAEALMLERKGCPTAALGVLARGLSVEPDSPVLRREMWRLRLGLSSFSSRQG